MAKICMNRDVYAMNFERSQNVYEHRPILFNPISSFDSSIKSVQKSALSTKSKEFRLPLNNSPNCDSPNSSKILKKNCSEYVKYDKQEDSTDDSEEEIISKLKTKVTFLPTSEITYKQNIFFNHVDSCNKASSSFTNKKIENYQKSEEKEGKDKKIIQVTESYTNRDNREEANKKTKKNKGKENNEKVAQSYKTKMKTELCKNWEQTGTCKFGDGCAFAHGEEEIKSKTHLPSNYKTKFCKQFHEEGYCTYGNRCQFVHLKIQKKMEKFGFEDRLRENLIQFQIKSKQVQSEKKEFEVPNVFGGRRLRIFEEICEKEANEVENTSDS